MQALIIEIMNQFGYLGIMALIAIENIFPPIPSEVILTFGGFMTTFTTLKPAGVILCSTIGSVLGALVLYAIGRWFNQERLERWVDGKLGHILHLKKEDIQKAEVWFQKRGKFTVFFCRFIPIIRSLISLPAGMSHMNLGIFVLLTTIGTAIWNTVLVTLGVIFGESWGTIVEYFSTYSSIIAVVCVIVGILCLILFYKSRLTNNDSKK